MPHENVQNLSLVLVFNLHDVLYVGYHLQLEEQNVGNPSRLAQRSIIWFRGSCVEASSINGYINEHCEVPYTKQTKNLNV